MERGERDKQGEGEGNLGEIACGIQKILEAINVQVSQQ